MRPKPRNGPSIKQIIAEQSPSSLEHFEEFLEFVEPDEALTIADAAIGRRNQSALAETNRL